MAFLTELLEKIAILIQNNFWLAPLFGVLLPFTEAIFPTIPLTVIVAFNYSIFAGAFGALEGAVMAISLSLIGSVLGMFLIFLIIRFTFADYFIRKVKENKYGQKFLGIVEGKNVIAVLLLMSNPFLPSSILNYALSLTKIKISKYLFLTIVSRLIIVIFLTFLGSTFDIQDNPWNILWISLVYFALFVIWFIYKAINKNNPKSIYKD